MAKWDSRYAFPGNDWWRSLYYIKKEDVVHPWGNVISKAIKFSWCFCGLAYKVVMQIKHGTCFNHFFSYSYILEDGVSGHGWVSMQEW